MIGILVSACLNVTLYNIVLIYLSLLYISLRHESTPMFIGMLFWASFFLLMEYLTSQFELVKQSKEMREMSGYLDLSPYNAFTFDRLDQFSYDKVIILLLLWARLQLHRYLMEIKASDYEEIV